MYMEFAIIFRDSSIVHFADGSKIINVTLVRPRKKEKFDRMENTLPIENPLTIRTGPFAMQNHFHGPRNINMNILSHFLELVAKLS